MRGLYGRRMFVGTDFFLRSCLVEEGKYNWKYVYAEIDNNSDRTLERSRVFILTNYRRQQAADRKLEGRERPNPVDEECR